jgi:hypothetical protein
MGSSKGSFKSILLLLITLGVSLIVVAAIASLPHGQQIIPIRMPGWRLATAVSGSILFISSLIVLLVGSVPDKELLTIDMRLNGAGTKVINYQYAYLTTVHDLLESIWRGIAPHLSAYNYGQDWILRDLSSGHILREIGPQWAKLNLGQQRDNRTLREIGIKPGMKLEVIRVTQS